MIPNLPIKVAQMQRSSRQLVNDSFSPELIKGGPPNGIKSEWRLFFRNDSLMNSDEGWWRRQTSLQKLLLIVRAAAQSVRRSHYFMGGKISARGNREKKS